MVVVVGSTVVVVGSAVVVVVGAAVVVVAGPAVVVVGSPVVVVGASVVVVGSAVVVVGAAVVVGEVAVDPEAPEAANLEAAVRLARLLALASLAEREVEIDAQAIGSALTAIREQLEVVRQLKSQLTSISNATKAVWTGLDSMRSAILTRVTEAESEIRAAADQA